MCLACLKHSRKQLPNVYNYRHSEDRFRFRFKFTLCRDRGDFPQWYWSVSSGRTIEMSLSNICKLGAEQEGRISLAPRMAASISRRFDSKSYGIKERWVESVLFYGNLRSLSLWKTLGLGVDWFTWLLVNAQRGGNDWVTATERKQREAEGRAVSDDTWRDAPSTWGWGDRLSLLWLLPKKVAAHFPQNIHVLYHIWLLGKFILLLWFRRGRQREEIRRKPEDK